MHDSDIGAPDDDPKDAFEEWLYYDEGDETGYLHKHTDVRGLTTEFTEYESSRVKTVITTDDYDDQTTETTINYDVRGFVDTKVLKISDEEISTTDFLYDVNGNLTQIEVRDSEDVPLSHSESIFSPDGYLIATIDGNQVRNEYEYDRAGLLTKETLAVGESYRALYTQQDESVEQVTTHEYYANSGLLKNSTLPGGIERQFYYDPVTRSQWSVTSGVSSGGHTHNSTGLASVSFNLSGTQIDKSEMPELGRKSIVSNRSAGAATEITHSAPGTSLNVTKSKDTAPGQTLEQSVTTDARGNALLQQSGGRAPRYARYDELGYLVSSADMADLMLLLGYEKHNPAGDLVEETQAGLVFMPGIFGLSFQFLPAGSVTTIYKYDEHGRLRETIDELVDDIGTEEANAEPATTDYEVNDDGLVVRTQVARSGATTLQWLDALGRLVKEQNELGGETTYTYDLAGRKIQKSFAPAAGDSAPNRVTSFQYDQLGRLRATIEEGSEPHFLAIDYFTNGHAGADGWNTIEFIALPGDDPLTYTDADRKSRATKTRIDALGNPYFIQQPDPNLNVAGDTPTTLITYSRLPNQGVTAVTTRTTVAETVAGTTGPSLNMNYAHMRVHREVNSALGKTIVIADRISDFSHADHVPPSTTDEYFLDNGFALITHNKYDALTGHLKETKTSRTASATKYEYTSFGQVQKVTHPDTNDTQYLYDFRGNLSAETDPRGNVTEYFYDVLGRKIATENADHKVTEITYANGGNQVQEKNARGYITTTTFDPLSRTRTTLDALGRETEQLLDSAGNVILETDIFGIATEHVYDRFGRKLETKIGTHPPTIFDYDIHGNLVSQTDSRNNETEFEYDPLGRRTKITDALDNETSFTYDVSGNQLSVIDDLGHTTSYEYDGLNRKTKEIFPDPDGTGSNRSTVNKFEFNAAGYLEKSIRVIDDNNELATTFEYDAMGRIKKETHPAPGGSGTGPVTTYEYDAAGNRTKLTDPEQNDTIWTYDELNRVKSETNELGKERKYEYDAVGNLTKYTDRENRVTKYTYDELNRRTGEEWLNASSAVIHTIDTEYRDSVSDQSSVSDSYATIAYTEFNQLGLPTEIEITTANSPVGTTTISQQFDAVGNREQFEIHVGTVSGFTNDYTYDALNRTNLITQTGTSAASKRIDYDYDAVGRLDLLKRYADAMGTALVTTADYGYDYANRLTSLAHNPASGSPIADYSWQFDSLGRITNSTSSSDGSVEYTYDRTDQLTGADYASTQTDESHTYDLNGNRTGVGYTTGDNNQTTADGTYSYEYDDEGNRERRTHVSSGAVTEYMWDHRNRLVKITEKPSLSGTVTKTVEYTYDPLNRRIAKSIDADGAGSGAADKTYFLHDGERSAREGAGDQIVLQLDDSGTITHRYLQGTAVDQILADEKFQSDILWPLADHLGTIRDLVSYDSATSTTTVENHIKYDAFGQIISETVAAVDHLFAFTGRERDEESGLQYYRGRYYDPGLGQFVSHDPMGFEAGDGNLRRYVGNHPTYAIDPGGSQERVIIRSKADPKYAHDLSRAQSTPAGKEHFEWMSSKSYSRGEWERQLRLALVAIAWEADGMPVEAAMTRSAARQEFYGNRGLNADHDRMTRWDQLFDELYGNPTFALRAVQNGTSAVDDLTYGLTTTVHGVLSGVERIRSAPFDLTGISSDQVTDLFIILNNGQKGTIMVANPDAIGLDAHNARLITRYIVEDSADPINFLGLKILGKADEALDAAKYLDDAPLWRQAVQGAPNSAVKNSHSLRQIRSLVESGNLDISDEAMSFLSRLRQPAVKANVSSNTKGFVEVTSDWMDLKVMSELQRAAKSEFALVESQGRRFLIRGQDAFGVKIPQSILNRGYTDLVHTHPGTNIFALRPSPGDISSLRVRSEIIVNEAGIAVEYLKNKENGRRLMRMWRVE